MLFDLRLGHANQQIDLEPENLIQLVRSFPYHRIYDFESTLEDRISNPIGTRPFIEHFKPTDKVTILVSDARHCTMSDAVTPYLIRKLKAIGVDPPQITCLVACGSNRRVDQNELMLILGREVIEQEVNVVVHDSKNEQELRTIGTTSYGNEVVVNKHLIDTDKIIITGAISFHHFAGYAGGRMSILPGSAGNATIQRNHQLVFYGTNNGFNTSCRPGNLEGNPIHLDMLEAMHMCSPDFLVNVILDHKNRAIEIVAGDPEQAHQRGALITWKLDSVRLERKLPLVIASCGGYPRDQNIIHAHQSLLQASLAAEPGGTIILFAECPEEIESESCLQWLKYKSPDVMETTIRKDYSLNSEIFLSMKRILDQFKVILFTSEMTRIPAELNIRSISDIDKLQILIKDQFANLPFYLIPFAGDNLPIY